MNELLVKIAARAAELVAGSSYYTPDGGKSPAIYLGALPPKRSDLANPADFPFVVIRPAAGSKERGKTKAKILMICGVAISADAEIDAGVAAVHDLADRLLNISADRSFSPWVLFFPIQWRMGDGEDFSQPHPFYYVTIELEFDRPAA